jgi:hypothetical protein
MLMIELPTKLGKHNTRSPCLPNSKDEIAKMAPKKYTWGPKHKFHPQLDMSSCQVSHPYAN